MTTKAKKLTKAQVLERQLMIEGTVISALMRRLGTETVHVYAAEMLDEPFEMEVERAENGDLACITVRRGEALR